MRFYADPKPSGGNCITTVFGVFLRFEREMNSPALADPPVTAILKPGFTALERPDRLRPAGSTEANRGERRWFSHAITGFLRLPGGHRRAEAPAELTGASVQLV